MEKKSSDRGGTVRTGDVNLKEHCRYKYVTTLLYCVCSDTCSLSKTFSTLSTCNIPISNNREIIQVGRDLWWSSSPAESVRRSCNCS